MGGYRNISTAFWTDSKIDDDFTPEDKYFYLYLMTNPHTSICGCYEISMKQMERETGYNTDTVKRLLQRMQETHNVIRYSSETKEVLLLNWWKYNWSVSQKVKNAVISVAEHIKHTPFKKYCMDMVSIRYTYPIHTSIDTTDTDTVSDTVSESVTETDTGTVSETETETENRDRDISADKPQKHKHGEYKHVLLTDDEYQKLLDDYGEQVVAKYIRRLDEYCEQSGKRYKNYNLALRNTFMARDGVKRKEEPKYNGIDAEDCW